MQHTPRFLAIYGWLPFPLSAMHCKSHLVPRGFRCAFFGIHISISSDDTFLIDPFPISILAELMLPDGAHMRSEDWTIFFLNQHIPDPEKIDAEADQDEAERKPLLYVLNLVRTKHDPTVKR